MPAPTVYTLAARIAEEPLTRLLAAGPWSADDADAILDAAIRTAAVAVFHHELAALPEREVV